MVLDERLDEIADIVGRDDPDAVKMFRLSEMYDLPAFEKSML